MRQRSVQKLHMMPLKKKESSLNLSIIRSIGVIDNKCKYSIDAIGKHRHSLLIKGLCQRDSI